MGARFPAVETVFCEALGIESEAERAAYLGRACGADAALRGQVDSLIDAHLRAGEFLATPAFPPAATAAEGPGGVIGPYVLREEIGEGGMGVVHMAEQTHPIRRLVALKVIKPGMDSRLVIARFEAERQALAMMDHPNIARVHDAGTTPSGRPYFAMELVRGLPITEHCDRECLPVRERLGLFVAVCRAVQHAHQKGVIHRDLKPTNVLVTVTDGTPVPKVIDFGIAKATGGGPAERAPFTQFHQVVGTPLYMSPEQSDPSSADVDTRSDIYSLGVLLYELLTGCTPFDPGALRVAAFDEVRRILREEEPPRPSARLGALGEALATVSARRGSDPRRLDRAVRGELDWIVMKALEKDRRRRYETANDFAADVVRYLGDQPVEACPPSRLYRFGKYARRNRVAMAAAAAAVAALVAVAVVSAWHARREAAEAALAREHTDQLNGVIGFLAYEAFSGAPSGREPDRSRTAADLLERTHQSVGERFPDKPLVEACMRMALTVAYLRLDDPRRAEAHAARAAELRARHLGPDHPHTLAALHQQCMASEQIASADPAYLTKAVGLARRVVEGRTRALGANDWHTLSMRSWLAYLLSRQGRLDEAVETAEQAEHAAARALGPDHKVTIEARRLLGVIAAKRGDTGRAVELLRSVYEARERTLGPLDRATLKVMGELADATGDLGRLDEACRLTALQAERSAEVSGPLHRSTDGPLWRLFALLDRRGDTVAIRDLSLRWMRAVLDAPAPADPADRERRRTRLARLALELATSWPPDPPLDPETASRVLGEIRGTRPAALLALRLAGPEEAEREARAAARDRDGGEPLGWLTAALILERLGEAGEARAYLERACKRLDDRPNDGDLAALRRLRREAQARLGPASPEADPTRGAGPRPR